MTWNEIMAEHGMVHNTFWSDFSIADRFGVNAVRDTYRRAVTEWIADVKMYTALVFCLNWRAWYWHGKNEDRCRLYVALFERAQARGHKTYHDEELAYFVKKLD